MLLLKNKDIRCPKYFVSHFVTLIYFLMTALGDIKTSLVRHVMFYSMKQGKASYFVGLTSHPIRNKSSDRLQKPETVEKFVMSFHGINNFIVYSIKTPEVSTSEILMAFPLSPSNTTTLTQRNQGLKLGG